MLIRNQLHDNPVLLTAPIAIAAYNIGGITVHSAFCLPVENHGAANYIPLKADISYVIIDEISMLSGRNFDFVNKRLCEMKNTARDPTVLLGGLSQPTDTDIDTLKQRATADSSLPPFDTALRIFPTRKQVKEYNQCFTVLTASQTASADVYSIAAINTQTSAPVYLTPIQESKPTANQNLQD